MVHMIFDGAYEKGMAIAYLVSYLLSSTQGFPQENFCKVGYL